MEEYRYFRQLSDPQIHAALIGISKLDWIYAKYNQSKEDVATVMYSNQFDVLPLLNKNGTYTQFYKTSVWGNYQKENITWKNIDEKNSIYYLTSLRDVFKQFNNQKVNYFFLSNHSEAIGLITIGNLNCKHIYLYFYNLINQLEKNSQNFFSKKFLEMQ